MVFFEVTKGIDRSPLRKRLRQTPFLRFGLRAGLVKESCN